jgi:SAM-dependent methyltransferase
MAIDNVRMREFMDRMVGEMGAAMSASLILLGDRLGLYKAMAEHGAMSSDALAEATGTAERYVREWLAAQAAAGYVTYDPGTRRYRLPPEEAMAFADETSPAFLPGFCEVIASLYRDEPKITAAFRSGEGVGWHEHDQCLFRGSERFFRPGYAAHLVAEWLPALDGVVEKLERGGTVADVGCGHGASTLIIAEAFPKARVVGFDFHQPSIERARRAADSAGLADRVSFEVATAKGYPGRGYDLVACFDCLHDMGDPAGAAAHVRQSLAPDGAWMIVEPFANDALEANLTPVGRIYYAASTMICTPCSRSQEVGLALGAQAGEKRLKEVVTAGGFGRFRRAAETPFNLVFEARP